MMGRAICSGDVGITIEFKNRGYYLEREALRVTHMRRCKF